MVAQFCDAHTKNGRLQAFLQMSTLKNSAPISANDSSEKRSSTWIVASLLVLLVIGVILWIGSSVFVRQETTLPPHRRGTSSGPDKPSATIQSMTPSSTTKVKSMTEMSGFVDWTKKYKKRYTEAEQGTRVKKWADAARQVEVLRLENPYARFEVNDTADLSPDEFLAFHVGPTMSNQTYQGISRIAMEQAFGVGGYQLPIGLPPAANNVGSSLNWADRGVLPPVHAQGACSASWSFVASDLVTAQYALLRSTERVPLVPLSIQQLIDCDQRNLGCRGGLLSNGLDYIRTNGLEAATTYPRTALREQCAYNVNSVLPKTRSLVFGNVPNNVEAIQEHLVAIGPLGSMMDATCLQFYQSGILTSKTTFPANQVNHAVLLVGFGNASGVGDYWIVRNSWGTSWGENGGYFRVLCGNNIGSIEENVMYAKLML